MKKLLKVPFKKQSFEYSCLPACVRMILRYYDDSVDERKLYKMGRILKYPGCSFDVLSQFLYKRGYRPVSFFNGHADGWTGDKKLIKILKREYKKSKRMGTKYRKNAKISTIKNFIDRGTPVIAEVKSDKFYRTKFKYTHAIVIIGYDRENFYYHDPEKKRGGKNKIIYFKKFNRCWIKLFSNVGRSLMIIERPKGAI